MFQEYTSLRSTLDTNYFREIVEEQLHSCKEKEQEYLEMLDISDVKYSNEMSVLPFLL
jgi:predicted thioredoxin/glutaredoxin